MSQNKNTRIRIGNQTTFVVNDPMIPFEYAVHNGFDAFEWFADRKKPGRDFIPMDMDKGCRHYIRDTARTHDIRLSVHAPWWVNPIKSEGHALIMKSLAFARDIEAALFNIHLFPDEGIETYIRAMTDLINSTAKMGLQLSIENTPQTPPEDFNKMFKLLKNPDIQHADHVGMCLDLGHANLCDPTRNDYLSFMDRLDGEVPIIHIHLHENYGDRDSHLTVLTGPSKKDMKGLQGFVKRLKKRNFSGAIILEQWPDPPYLLNQARDWLQKLFENESHRFWHKRG
jgi:sugar phosphate isomerase/epimerase